MTGGTHRTVWRVPLCTSPFFLASSRAQTWRLHARAASAACTSQKPPSCFSTLLFYSCCFLRIVPFPLRPGRPPLTPRGLRSVVTRARRPSLTHQGGYSLGTSLGGVLLPRDVSISWLCSCVPVSVSLPPCEAGRSYLTSVLQYLAEWPLGLLLSHSCGYREDG